MNNNHRRPAPWASKIAETDPTESMDNADGQKVSVMDAALPGTWEQAAPRCRLLHSSLSTRPKSCSLAVLHRPDVVWGEDEGDEIG